MKSLFFRLAWPVFVFLFYLWGAFLFGQDRAMLVESVSGSGGQKYAFLVGVSDYEYPNNFPGLSYTVKDVEAWKKQLEEIGFPSNNIVVKASFRPVAHRPSKEKILSSLRELLSKVGSNDIIICVFSGHGTQVGTEQYFCPEDARLDNLEASCVSLNEVLSSLNNSQAKFKWLIVDACRNDPTKSAELGVKSLGKVEEVPKGVAVIFSCAAREKSYEDPTLGLGVFTHFMMQGLSGKAADKHGIITILDLYKYVQDRTPDFVKTKYGTNQVPYWAGEFTNFTIRDDLLIEGVNRLKWQEAESSYQLAIASRRKKDYSQALIEIKKSLSILPTKHVYLDERSFIEQSLDRETRNLANSYAKLAKDYLDAKDYAKAQLEIDKALKLFPEDVGYELVQTSIQIRSKPSVPSEPIIVPPASRPSPSATQSGDNWSDSKAGERKVLTIQGIEYAFRWCPAGKFMMGSPSSEAYRSSDETQHQVTLSQGFWMLETEVTQWMWERVMGSNPSWFSANGSGSSSVKGIDTKNFPVENVSWDDCQSFITKLNSLLSESHPPTHVGGSQQPRDNTQRAPQRKLGGVLTNGSAVGIRLPSGNDRLLWRNGRIS